MRNSAAKNHLVAATGGTVCPERTVVEAFPNAFLGVLGFGGKDIGWQYFRLLG
jgi:hypothetical protein